MRFAAVLAVGILLVTTVQALDQPESRVELSTTVVEQVLESLRGEYAVPGFAVVVAERHGVIGSGAVGAKRAGGDDLLTPNSRFHIGSVSKPLSSTAIGALVETGVLEWDSRVLEVLPELGETTRPAYARVTLRQLRKRGADRCL